jgi:hypothetical protein
MQAQLMAAKLYILALERELDDLRQKHRVCHAKKIMYKRVHFWRANPEEQNSPENQPITDPVEECLSFPRPLPTDSSPATTLPEED